MENYYIDSGIFLTPLLKNRDEKIIDKCLEWQNKIKDGKIIAYTSYLTWDEVIYIVKRNKGRELSTLMGKVLLNFPNINFIEVNKSIIENAQELLEKFNVKPRDAIHTATSLQKTNGNIITLDVIKSDYIKIKDNFGNSLLKIIEIK